MFCTLRLAGITHVEADTVIYLNGIHIHILYSVSCRIMHQLAESGGGDFFLACVDFGGRFNDSLFFFFNKWGSACAHRLWQRIETTVAECSLMSCV